MPTMTVNGTTHSLDVDPETPLLWVLRDHLHLTGAKYSCGIGQCGACTVHVDGEAMRSCVITVGSVEHSEITTIEGLAGDPGDRLREAWTHEEVPQCGYCQPGQIMTAAAFLADNPDAADESIEQAMSRVLCRCGTYEAIRRAVRRAAER
jgi:isoquinoline 1-oxidoreductase alpha subunit